MSHHSLTYTLVVQAFFLVVGIIFTRSPLQRRRIIGFVLILLALLGVAWHVARYGWH